MRFRFDERKATQAAAHLLRRHGGTLNYMVLIKLLYLADRRSLLACGRPITGDRMVAMPKGPVLSGVLDFVTWGPVKRSPWFDLISEPQGHDVKLKADPGKTDQLSDFEVSVLDEVDADFGSMDRWDLIKLLHRTLPEWTDPEGSSYTIDPAQILRAESRSEQEITRLQAEAEHLWFMASLADESAD